MLNESIHLPINLVWRISDPLLLDNFLPNPGHALCLTEEISFCTCNPQMLNKKGRSLVVASLPFPDSDIQRTHEDMNYVAWISLTLTHRLQIFLEQIPNRINTSTQMMSGRLG